MSSDAEKGGTAGLAPDDAFAVLGNETRMDVLRTLGEAGEPLSFSDLRDRVGMDDPGQFNYHLDRLVGHFVRRTGDGSGGRATDGPPGATNSDGPASAWWRRCSRGP